MEFIKIEVNERAELGSAAVRRLRRDGSIPAVLYGLKRRTLSITMPLRDLERFLDSNSRLVELTMGDDSRDAILRDVQINAVTDEILHVDFQRVEKDAKLEDQVRVTYKGQAPGTREGGLFQSLIGALTVRARPRDLPGELVLDISELHVDDGLKIRDIDVPEGVEFLHDLDDVVCQVVVARGGDELEEDEGEAGEGEAATEASAEAEAATES